MLIFGLSKHIQVPPRPLLSNIALRTLFSLLINAADNRQQRTEKSPSSSNIRCDTPSCLDRRRIAPVLRVQLHADSEAQQYGREHHDRDPGNRPAK